MKKYILEYYTNKKYELRSFDLNELKVFKKDREYVFFYLYFEELYSILKLNIGEFWEYLLKISEFHRMNSFLSYEEILQPTLYINQKLSNILTSFKSYESILKHNISDNYELLEIEKSQVKKIFSNTYDKYFAYRFMARLRNYTQHFKLPIQGLNYSSKVINENEKIVAYSVDPKLKKSDLLKYKKWSSVKNEIEKLDDSIKCKPIINEFYKSVNDLHGRFRNLLEPKYQDVVKRLNLILNEIESDFKKQNDEKSEFTVYISEYENNTYIDSIWIPFNVIERIDKMVFRNKVNLNLNYTFTTMENLE